LNNWHEQSNLNQMQSTSSKKLYLYIIISVFIIVLMGISNTLIGTSSAASSPAGSGDGDSQTPQVASNNRTNTGTTDAVNKTNITSFTSGIISNISSTKDFVKIGSISLKDIQNPNQGISIKSEENSSETVIPTRVGYNDTKAYLQAKIGASLANVATDQTIYTFSPNDVKPLVYAVSNNNTNGLSTNSNLNSSLLAGQNTSSSSPTKNPPLISTAINSSTNRAGGSNLLSTDKTTNTSLAINQTLANNSKTLKINKVLNDSLDINSGCGISMCTPSDNEIGVGKNQVIQMVNVAGKIWDKNNGTIMKYFALKDFFLTKTDTISDPYLYFDQDSGRWFASIFDVSTESYHIAVSNLDDPMKNWTIYNLGSFNSCPDQGKFAVNKDLFVISVNVFGSKCSDGFKGVQYTIASKSDMINGENKVNSRTEPSKPNLFSLLPVQPLSSSSSLYMVSVGDFGTSNVQLLSISGFPPNTTSTSFSIPIKTAIAPVQAHQPGDSNMLDTADGRVSTAAYMDGKIWLAFNDKCQIERVSHACIRLVEIDVTNLQKPIQDFDLAAKGSDVFYPTLTIDNGGNLLMAFGISSSSIYPSIMITTQSPSSIPNTLEKPVYLAEGKDPNNSGRSGDYDGAEIDANSNAWFTHEYVKDESGWATLISSVSRK